MVFIRVFLALSLSGAVAAKLLRPSDAGLLPSWVLWTLTISEMIVAILLLSRKWRIGAWAAAGLGTLFLCGLAALTLAGKDVQSCGCLGDAIIPNGAHVGVAVAIVVLGTVLGNAPARNAGCLS